MYRFIVIEGNIGAGKTTLSTMIANQFNAKLVLEEFADNPFLPKFYSHPDKYAFPLELSFLAERFHQLNNELGSGDLFKTFTVADYYFSKSLIFARNTLGEDEYKLYRKLYDIIYKSLPKPDLFVYLHVNTSKLINNIHQRGRDYEKNITVEYLQKISDGYFEYIKNLNNQKILILDTTHIDFVHNEADYKKLIEIIFAEYPHDITRKIL